MNDDDLTKYLQTAKRASVAYRALGVLIAIVLVADSAIWIADLEGMHAPKHLLMQTRLGLIGMMIYMMCFASILQSIQLAAAPEQSKKRAARYQLASGVFMSGACAFVFLVSLFLK